MGITAGSEYGVLGDSYVSANKSISTTESLLAAGSVNLTGRETIIIFNKGTANIFIGPTGVTTSTGLKIVPNQMMTLNAGEQINIYAITDTGTASVVVQELA